MLNYQRVTYLAFVLMCDIPTFLCPRHILYGSTLPFCWWKLTISTFLGWSTIFCWVSHHFSCLKLVRPGKVPIFHGEHWFIHSESGEMTIFHGEHHPFWGRAWSDSLAVASTMMLSLGMGPLGLIWLDVIKTDDVIDDGWSLLSLMIDVIIVIPRKKLMAWCH